LELNVCYGFLGLKVKLNKKVIVNIPSQKRALVHANSSGNVFLLVVFRLIDIGATIFGVDRGLSNFELEAANGDF